MSKNNLITLLNEHPEQMDAILEEANKDLITSGGRVYTGKSVEARRLQYIKNKELRAQMLENKVPFITPEFDPDFFLCQGMTLVTAMSGQSKSTTCANVIAGFTKYSPKKQVTVITNEEGTDAVIDRVACILLQKSYIDLYKGKLKLPERNAILDKSIELANTVDVVDSPDWDMTCLEDVQAVLDHAANQGVSLVVLDYLQTITHSKEYPQMESFKISKLLGLYLKAYGKRVGVPVVVFAQLKSKSEAGALQDRIQNDKTIYNHAFNVLEVVPNFATKLTEFIIHKGRFELHQGKKITMKFVNGRYEMDEDAGV